MFKSGTPKNQAGVTLVELMISITLGLFVVLAATALLLSTKTGYTSQDEGARVDDTGRYAIESIARAVRQAAFENWDREDAPLVTARNVGANIEGLDAASLKATTSGVESPLSGVGESDVLAVRFFGAGAGDEGDRTIINCAGFGTPAAQTPESADADRGWSIFYVAKDASDEPELRCKYFGNNRWNSQAIARGVESFQVLYGLDSDDDGLANQFLNAAAINALESAPGSEGPGNRRRRGGWRQVVVVRVALLVRGSENARSDSLKNEYDLFGKDYADKYADQDPGTRIKEEGLPGSVRNRMRKVFSTTIQIRNQSVPGTT